MNKVQNGVLEPLKNSDSLRDFHLVMPPKRLLRLAIDIKKKKKNQLPLVVCFDIAKNFSIHCAVFRDIVQETGIKTIPMEKKCKKAK